MADLKFDITFDLGSVLDISRVVNKQVFPLLHQAVRAVAKQGSADWQKAIYQAKLWSGEKDAYAATVTWKMTGDFTALIQSDYKHAAEIESGRPARDLKQMLNTSLKVRRTEKGKRFLVIPMRHNVKKLEDAGLYGAAKALEESMIIGQGERASGEVTRLSPRSGMSKSASQSQYLSDLATRGDMMVNQNSYSWGGKLSAADTGGNKWAEGMRRFDTSTPGGGKSSTYLTFRIMMEGSKGWVVPAQPGQHLVRKVTTALQPKAQAAFAAAIKKQLGGN